MQRHNEDLEIELQLEQTKSHHFSILFACFLVFPDKHPDFTTALEVGTRNLFKLMVLMNLETTEGDKRRCTFVRGREMNWCARPRERPKPTLDICCGSSRSKDTTITIDVPEVAKQKLVM